MTAEPFSFNLKNSQKIFFFCLIWTAFWLSSAGIHLIFIESEKILCSYTSTGYSLFYFMAVIASTVFIFKIYEQLSFVRFYNSQFFWIGVSLFAFLLINPLVNFYIPLKPELASHLLEIRFYYPFFYFGSSAVKMLDIVFQQTLIFVFLNKVTRLSGDPKKSIILFGVCFFTLHLPLLYFFKWAAFAFIVPCLIAGFIFSYLNLYYKKSGILLCFIIHELFYVVLGLSLRLFY